MELAGALLALAFPDRIGQHREGSDGRYLLANGRGAAFSCQVSLAREEFIVAVELDDREREARIDLAAPLTRALLEQLFASHIVTEARFGWEPISERGNIRARRVTGNCVQHQRDIAIAVKNAREVALLPFSSATR